MKLQEHSIQISQVPVSRQIRPPPPPPPPPPHPPPSPSPRLRILISQARVRQQTQTRPIPPPPPLPKKRGNRWIKPDATYLSEDQRGNYMNVCIPLYIAAVKGDWHTAEGIIRDHPEAIHRSITKREDTLLHIVASTKHTHFAHKLVNMMKVKDLELQNGDGETALFLALASTIEMVDILLNRNNDLLKIRNKDNSPPFLCAVKYGNKHMVSYIYLKTNLADEMWKTFDQKSILIACLGFGLYDIALDIFNRYRHQGNLTNYAHVLRYLANNPDVLDGTMGPGTRRRVNALLSGTRLRPKDNPKAVKIVRMMWGEILEQKHEHTLKQIAGEGHLFTAARLGNYKFIIELLSMYPDITWDRDENLHTIFHIAVMHRQENIYNLLHEVRSKKLEMKDCNGNNIVHLAALKPPQNRLNSVSGAALQMQRELLWFQEVQTLVGVVYRKAKNYNGKSPQELFTDEHTELREKGEIWMKERATHCMVVAALITTITFAAAFTLPGGNDSDNGNPIFMKRSAFIVFVVADAISLLASSTSILMFLAILMARYTENDFLVSLPMKLMGGILALFISITTMMIAFSASIFLLYAKSTKWIPTLVTALSGVPVFLFVRLQYRLLVDVVNSTFNSRHLFRPRNLLL